MTRLWPFGRKTEHSDAEVDRETEEARQRHETRLEERRALHDLLRAEVDEMPEVALVLEPGERAFTSVYTLPRVSGMPSDFKPKYGMTVPAQRVLDAYADPEWKRLLVTHANFRPASNGRSDMPWDYARLANGVAPEVYTIDKQTMENQPSDLDWLISELARIEVRNRPRDNVFEGRKLKVHLRPYAYWTGSLSFDKAGIGLSLKRVGLYTGRGL